MFMENVIIIGSGPAGYTAAIYASRANLKPIMFEGTLEKGGQLMLTTEVENYPGFPEGVQGPDLMDKFRKQAERFGTKFVNKLVDKIEFIDKNNKNTKPNSQKGFKLFFKEKGKEASIETKAIIISTGASANWTNLPSEMAFKGKGITTCATCDGFFFKEKNVIVVGGGDSACEEASFLSRIGIKSIKLVHRRDELRASKIMQDRVKKDPKIQIIWNSEINEFYGNGDKLEGVKLKNLKTNKISDLKIDGVFLAIGHTPNTKFLNGILELDEKGYIKTDARTRTSVDGIFACGDAQDFRYRQAVTAAGSGCQSAMESEKYLENLE